MRPRALRACRSSAFAAVALLGLSSLLGGCATHVTVRSMQPARVHLGSADHLTVMESQGRRSARETVLIELDSQARRRGYYTVEDESDQDVRVRVKGRRVGVSGLRRPLDVQEVGLRIDVVEWDTHQGVEEVKRKREDGTQVTETVRTLEGEVILAVTAFDGRGKAFLSEKEYRGVRSGRYGEVSRDDLILAAAEAAVSALLADITPREVRSRVRLDSDDEGQEPILELAKAGNVAAAADEARRYLKRHPQNPSAAYNLAVLLDAMGEYEDALWMYDRALRLGDKDFYATARAGCARRLADQRALQPVPAAPAPR